MTHWEIRPEKREELLEALKDEKGLSVTFSPERLNYFFYKACDKTREVDDNDIHQRLQTGRGPIPLCGGSASVAE